MNNENKISLSEAAIEAIARLQHKAGTHDYYSRALDALYGAILDQGDELGMSATEILHFLRALRDIRLDLSAIAGVDMSMHEAVELPEPGRHSERIAAAFESLEVPVEFDYCEAGDGEEESDDDTAETNYE